MEQNKQITAVEWLIEQMLVCNYISKKQFENANTWLIQEAKEMHKQQIEDTYIFAKQDKSFGNHISEDAEQYYNDKYGEL